jgi:ketosteroid isomerase-like protein
MTQAALDAVAAVARSWEAACRALDSDRIVGHLANNAVVWFNYDPGTELDKAAYHARLEAARATFANQRYTDMRVHLHPGGFAQQATVESDTPAGVMATPFLLIATVEDGAITRIAEYSDTTGLHRAGLLSPS